MSCLILHPIDLFYFTCMMIDRASCVRYGLVCAVSFLQRNWGHLADDIEAGALAGQHINEVDLSAVHLPTGHISTVLADVGCHVVLSTTICIYTRRSIKLTFTSSI